MGAGRTAITASLDDVAREFVAMFERMGVPYAMMGGLVVRLHALPRPTFDVDFTVSMTRDALPDLYRAAESLGCTILAAQASEWIDTVRV